MVYDWSDKRQECFRLYVVEGKSLDELMAHMRREYDFEPSKRSYQIQFKRWSFPNKRACAGQHDPLLINRVHELWKTRQSQNAMLQCLQAEGWDLNQRELTAIRNRRGLLLRRANGSQQAIHGLAQRAPDLEMINLDVATLNDSPSTKRDRNSRDRRRRSQVPAEPGVSQESGRFPSETTLDEAKSMLRLSKSDYKQVREHFAHICAQEGVLKKTASGPTKWQLVKQRLVRESPRLTAEIMTAAFIASGASREWFALDVICMDVAKRVRSRARQMSVAAAKEVLALDPDESRVLRAEFTGILRSVGFVSMSESGAALFDQLKERWWNSSVSVQKRLRSRSSSAGFHEVQEQALEVLSRDILKRVRDEASRSDLPEADLLVFQSGSASDHPHASEDCASPDPTSVPDQHRISWPESQHFQPVAILFRLHPKSPLQTEPRIWLSTLEAPRYSSLVSSATCTHVSPQVQGNAQEAPVVCKVEGLLPSKSTSPLPFQIEQDDEVQAFLQFVGNGKLVFRISFQQQSQHGNSG